MINPQRDHPELFDWLMMVLDPQSPMERIEAIEEAEEVIEKVVNGELAVIHGTKSGFESWAKEGQWRYFLLDTLKRFKEGGADEDQAPV